MFLFVCDIFADFVVLVTAAVCATALSHVAVVVGCAVLLLVLAYILRRWRHATERKPRLRREDFSSDAHPNAGPHTLLGLHVAVLQIESPLVLSCVTHRQSAV